LKIANNSKISDFSYVISPLLVVLIYCCSVVYQTWLSEDGFIFIKYIDNFVNLRGLVFNVGERVEGFTSPLWIFFLSLIFKLAPLNINSVVILSSYILSLLSVLIMLKNLKFSISYIPLGFYILFTNGAIIDFSTSGFETPLSIFLAIVLCILIKEYEVEQKPFSIGMIISLLVLNRPETTIILIYFISYFLFLLLTVPKNKTLENLSAFGFFLLPTIILLIPYEAFRIAYYSSVFPNTFYEKKAAYIYLSQGWLYILDFLRSYWISFFLIVLVLFRHVRYKFFLLSRKEIHILAVIFLLSAYVIFQGGDYMHGRSLILPFIFLCFLIREIKISIFKNHKLYSFICHFILIIALCSQTSITKSRSQEINNINDERYHIFGKSSFSKFKNLFLGEIPNSYGWRDRGYYYKELAEMTNNKLRIVFPNIGYFSYAAGEDILVLGPLIDFYRSKVPIPYRGKIGHEGDWIFQEYLISRKPHFAFVPFKEWRDAASFKVGQFKYSYIIKDYTYYSLIPITLLVDALFLDKFSSLVNVDVKREIDKRIINFLIHFNNEEYSSLPIYYHNFFGFLEFVWFPYVDASGRKLFLNKKRILSKFIISKQEYFELCHSDLSTYFNKHISGPFNYNNLGYDEIIFSLQTISRDVLSKQLVDKNIGCSEPTFGFMLSVDFRSSAQKEKSFNIQQYNSVKYLPIKILAPTKGREIRILIGGKDFKLKARGVNENGPDVILAIENLSDEGISSVKLELN